MGEFDRFVKHELKVKNYVRYTDDFVILADSQEYLEALLPKIGGFLKRRLLLDLHPKKIIFRRLHQGVDFLGYVTFPTHRLVRRKTMRRILKKMQAKMCEYECGKITKPAVEQSLQSYLGVLIHANAYGVTQDFLNRFWFGWLRS